jgi:hypothetical protein
MFTDPHSEVECGKHGPKVDCGERETTYGAQMFDVIIRSPQEREAANEI